MESDLISRSALLEGAMAERYKFLREENGYYDHYTDGFENAMLYVEDAPAVDAVEVCRCKDCKHCFFDLSGRDYHICMKNGFPFRNRVQDDDFCSYGERRADDGK